MKRDIEKYLPFPLLLWRALTKPCWILLALVFEAAASFILWLDEWKQ